MTNGSDGGSSTIRVHRRERLYEIGRQLSIASPPSQIVGLQECWTQEDYHAICNLTKEILPYSKFYYSGFFGSGLVILSAWPIEESTMYAYPLNGRPAAFYRGDWYVGKGIACARIRIGTAAKDIVEVFCTHLHAPYEAEDKDSYACHRTAQAWEIAKVMRHAAERGHMVIGLGDFNMLPTSLAHRIIKSRSPVQDVWRLGRAAQTLGHEEMSARSVRECLEVHGVTCDSALNTWRWSKQMRKDLRRGKEPSVDLNAIDNAAKRLDYIFLHMPASTKRNWTVEDVKVGMTERHPTLHVSLSDHFSIEATLKCQDSRLEQSVTSTAEDMTVPLDSNAYEQIINVIRTYMQRERKQRFWQLLHFAVSIAASVACLGSIWASDRIWLAFILALISTLLLSTGLLSGLMGGLFVKQEIRALKEFLWEVEAAQRLDMERMQQQQA